MELVIQVDGAVRCIYGEKVDLHTLGRLTVQRASHVEPTEDGQWTADLAPVGGPLLGPFGRRSEALEAEQEWLTTERLSICYRTMTLVERYADRCP